MLLDVHLVRHIIQSLWGLFILYWLAHARGNKKSVYRQSRWAWLLYLTIFFVFVNAILPLRRLRIRVLPYTIVTQTTGIVLCAAGIALAIWARRVLGTNWSGMVTLKEGHVLIRHGPYRFVRHPIYSGVILAVVGSFAATLPTWQGLVCVLYLLVGLRVKSLQEERLLARQFPAEYASYRRDVKALIPFVY